jgi:hypothetical protein
VPLPEELLVAGITPGIAPDQRLGELPRLARPTAPDRRIEDGPRHPARMRMGGVRIREHGVRHLLEALRAQGLDEGAGEDHHLGEALDAHAQERDRLGHAAALVLQGRAREGRVPSARIASERRATQAPHLVRSEGRAEHRIIESDRARQHQERHGRFLTIRSAAQDLSGRDPVPARDLLRRRQVLGEGTGLGVHPLAGVVAQGKDGDHRHGIGMPRGDLETQSVRACLEAHRVERGARHGLLATIHQRHLGVVERETRGVRGLEAHHVGARGGHRDLGLEEARAWP